MKIGLLISSPQVTLSHSSRVPGMTMEQVSYTTSYSLHVSFGGGTGPDFGGVELVLKS